MAKYGYQAHFGLLKILEAHESGADYRMVFDYIDDLTLLDSSTSPTTATTYQVKAKSSGSWTVANISYRSKSGDLPRSIVGKMYFNIASMNQYVSGITFVSNAPFSVELAGGKKSGEADTSIKGLDLAGTEIAKLDAAVTADFSPHPGHPYIERLSLHQCSLGVQDQDLFLKGKLAVFLSAVAKLDEAPVNAVYDTLISTAIARTGTARTYSDTADFYKQKSIGKPEIEELITKIKSKKGFLEHWNIIEIDLLQNGMSTIDVIRTKTAALRHLSQRTAGERTAISIADGARSLFAAKPTLLATSTSMYSLAQSLVAGLSAKMPSTWNVMDSTGACLVEAFEAINGQ